MNGVWFVLIVGSILAAAYNGQMEALTRASIESAKSAVTLALGLVGVMAFWLGMMRILQAAGFLQMLSRADVRGAPRYCHRKACDTKL